MLHNSSKKNLRSSPMGGCQTQAKSQAQLVAVLARALDTCILAFS